MPLKLTLSVDATVISRAKRYARQRGISVSRLVETYLDVVSKPAGAKKAPPILSKVRGTLQHADVRAYRKHLSEKYR